MKKLMTFVGVAMLACVTQGAAVTWNSGTIYVPDSSGKPTTTVAKSSTAYAIELFFFKDNAGAVGDAITGVGGNTDTTTSSLGVLNGVTTGTSFDANVTYHVYAVMTYGTWTMTSATGAFTQKGTGNVSINFGTGGSLGGTGLWPTTWTSTAVPEPATVGLLLLGLCAVGLKRRV